MSSVWSKEVFAKNLRTYIERSGKSQREIAEIVGVAAPTFNEWINGKKYPRIDKIQRLADYFGIMKSDLIEDKLTEEKEKDNDALAAVIVRMRMDAPFRAAVDALYKLDREQLDSVRKMLNALAK